MKVMCLTRYGEWAASSRVRHFQHQESLKNLGVNVEYFPFYNDSFAKHLQKKAYIKLFHYPKALIKRLKVLMNQKDYDLIWVEKDIFPFMPNPWEHFAIKRPFVIDIDDVDWLKIKMPIFKTFIVLKYRNLFHQSKLITCSNPRIVNLLNELGFAGICLETYAEQLLDVTESSKSFGRNRLLWVGSPSTIGPLRLIVPQLELLLSRGFTFSSVGAGDNHNLPGGPHLAWSKENVSSQLKKSDIVLAPSGSTGFDKYKSSYKALLGLMNFRPVVGDDAPSNSEFKHLPTFFAVKNIDKWASEIFSVYSNYPAQDDLVTTRTKLLQTRSPEILAVRILNLFNEARHL